MSAPQPQHVGTGRFLHPVPDVSAEAAEQDAPDTKYETNEENELTKKVDGCPADRKSVV